jgi:tetratricopeptide (TPR) repeat protein
VHYYVQGVPFVKQKGNLCGPAALSSVFSYYGNSISQEEIARAIYLIPVHGVLNIDLENYASEQGLWTYVSYDNNVAKIKDMIRRDIPVLALMESSHIPFKKSYHYVVILGYEDDQKVFLAHTGKRPNEAIPYKSFIAQWGKAEFWSLVVCPKEKITWDIDVQGHNKLGILYEREGNFDRAIAHYEASLKQSETPEAYFNLGNTYLRKKDYKQAIPYYQEALERNPRFADCYNNLAYTYMEENQNLDEAIRYARRAIRLKPANKVYYLDTLGMVQFRKGLLEEAMRSFEQATELAVDKEMGALIYYHFGLVKMEAGLIEEAKKILEKSVELDPQSQAQETLKSLLITEMRAP